MVFPFAARVEEYQRGPVHQGARVTVLAVTFLDETYGTIVAVKHKNGVNELPLCDLKATEAAVETRQLVEDYAVWFANRVPIPAVIPETEDEKRRFEEAARRREYRLEMRGKGKS